MLHTHYQALCLVVSEEKIFKVFILKIYFSLCDLDMEWTKIIWTILKEGHIRIISSKFGQNPASSLGRDVIWSNCGRRTTHDGRRTPNDHNSSPWAIGYGELKISMFGVTGLKILDRVGTHVFLIFFFCKNILCIELFFIIFFFRKPEKFR